MNRPLRITVVNKSDSTGGAAVVSRRLTQALRTEGADARMLVTEKLTDHQWVTQAAPHWRSMVPFVQERLGIFAANGLDRATLFKMDTATHGLPLWRHPLIAGADAVLLNWVNQGMLSLDGVRRIAALGKPVVWTMHDMWCMTGVCHHAGTCKRFAAQCGDCPLLGHRGRPGDISHRTWLRKSRLDDGLPPIHYVPVSTWLRDKALESSLLRDRDLTVIPNAFTLPDGIPESENPDEPGRKADGKTTILFGAARLDDTVKGLPALHAMTHALVRNHPRLAQTLELVTFGGVKDPAALRGFGIAHRHLGTLHGEQAIRGAYRSGHILVSASLYETLPGTLVEAQAYGCIPVATDMGGQRDIVTHGSTGFLVHRPADDPGGTLTGALLADAVAQAAAVVENPGELAGFRKRMRDNVAQRFDSGAVARRYLQLINRLRLCQETS